MTVTNYATDNNYATLFFAYISRSLGESLATVRAVETRLPDEERVQACHVLDFGLRAPDAWPQARDLTVALASYMERSGQWELWEQLLRQALATAQRLGDTAQEITVTALLARLYQRRGDAQAMVRHYRQVIRVARRSGNRYELARACSNLGYYYIERGHLWRAEVLSLTALAIFDELASDHGRAHTHNHLGILFTRQYDWMKAKEHLIAACTIWQASQDQYGLMRGHGNLAFLAVETASYADLIYHSAIALDLAEKLGDESLIGTFASNLSFGHLKTDNLPKAKQFANLAEKVFKQYSDRLGLARSAHTNGLIAIDERNYLQAQEQINYALNALTELHNHYFLFQVKLTKIHLETQLQNYAIANQELTELDTLITKHLVGNALKIYTDKLLESRCRLEQAARRHRQN